MLNPRNIDLAQVNYKLAEEDPDNISSFVQHCGRMPSLYRAIGPFLYNEVNDVIKKYFADTKQELIQEWEMEDEYYKSSSYKAMTSAGSFMLIKLKKSYVCNDSDYVFPAKKKKYKDGEFGWIVTPEVEILYDFEAGKPKELIDKLNKLKLDVNNEHNKIGLICQDSDGSLYTKDFPLMKEDFDFDLDLHYGQGFTKFHDIMTKRIDNSEKGIILFHGTAGSGKTFYIRRLVRDLMRRNKKIIYMPNNMVDLLGTPSFNNFLLEYVEDSLEEGNHKGLLMIIEDAEKVLLKRDTNPYGSSGVSNILNSTDGILNDFLSIQVLCTFNTELENIDSAILRKKRAISVKEFGKLSIEDSQKLIDHLKIKHEATEPMVLADIYSILDEAEDEILLGKKKKTKSIGFGVGK
jgi:GTPase SAR1 family protein